MFGTFLTLHYDTATFCHVATQWLAVSVLLVVQLALQNANKHFVVYFNMYVLFHHVRKFCDIHCAVMSKMVKEVSGDWIFFVFEFFGYKMRVNFTCPGGPIRAVGLSSSPIDPMVSTPLLTASQENIAPYNNCCIFLNTIITNSNAAQVCKILLANITSVRLCYCFLRWGKVDSVHRNHCLIYN